MSRWFWQCGKLMQIHSQLSPQRIQFCADLLACSPLLCKACCLGYPSCVHPCCLPWSLLERANEFAPKENLGRVESGFLWDYCRSDSTCTSPMKSGNLPPCIAIQKHATCLQLSNAPHTESTCTVHNSLTELVYSPCAEKIFAQKSKPNRVKLQPEKA